MGCPARWPDRERRSGRDGSTPRPRPGVTIAQPGWPDPGRRSSALAQSPCTSSFTCAAIPASARAARSTRSPGRRRPQDPRPEQHEDAEAGVVAPTGFQRPAERVGRLALPGPIDVDQRCSPRRRRAARGARRQGGCSASCGNGTSCESCGMSRRNSRPSSLICIRMSWPKTVALPGARDRHHLARATGSTRAPVMRTQTCPHPSSPGRVICPPTASPPAAGLLPRPAEQEAVAEGRLAGLASAEPLPRPLDAIDAAAGDPALDGAVRVAGRDRLLLHHDTVAGGDADGPAQDDPVQDELGIVRRRWPARRASEARLASIAVCPVGLSRSFCALLHSSATIFGTSSRMAFLVSSTPPASQAGGVDTDAGTTARAEGRRRRTG